MQKTISLLDYLMDTKNKAGLSEDLTYQQVMHWMKENLSQKARYDLRLTQKEDGNYIIDVSFVMKFEKHIPLA